MKPIVNITEFSEIARQPHVVLVDARGGAGVYEKYLTAHLENAIYVDLEKDLAHKTDPKFGGRHPLPDIRLFAKKLGELGISPVTKIFVYDEKTGAMAAARFWWMMKAVGHEHVFVLNGGMQAAIQAGFPVTDKIPEITPCDAYPVTEWKMPVITMQEVENEMKNKTSVLIDVREAYRYNGESEPIDLVAGHIPGAVNIPYLENLDADGNFISDEELKKKYEEVVKNNTGKDIICQCGSGVTACHTILAMEQAGIKNVKLYVGSWSEWSRNEKEIVAK